MSRFSTFLKYLFTRMGYGDICFLCILTFIYPNVVPTARNTVSVLILSGLIGILSMIMHTDLPLSVSLLIHLIGTFFIFWLMVSINQWGFNWWSILLFIVIYVVIWLICILEQRKAIGRINAAIRNKQSNNH